ncbi:MAG: hypothetical protein ACI86M_002895 [Saprospiraceae bacterium]|jgi:hypothetical protein
MNNTNHYNRLLLQSFCLLILTFGSSINYLNAQDTLYKKNSILIGYGNLIFTSQASASYERLVFQEDKNRIKIRLDYSSYLSNNLDYDTDARVHEGYKGISGVLLHGIFEVSVGIAFTSYKLAKGFSSDPLKDYTKILNGRELFGSAGIRYDKDSLILRAGIGNLDLLYAGVGFSF